MFAYSTEDRDARAARRVVRPPLDVEVDLGMLWPPQRHRWGLSTPLWVRSQGVQVSNRVPARLHEWVLTACGDWYGRCELTVTVDGGEMTLDQLVPAKALHLQTD